MAEIDMVECMQFLFWDHSCNEMGLFKIYMRE